MESVAFPKAAMFTFFPLLGGRCCVNALYLWVGK